MKTFKTAKKLKRVDPIYREEIEKVGGAVLTEIVKVGEDVAIKAIRVTFIYKSKKYKRIPIQCLYNLKTGGVHASVPAVHEFLPDIKSVLAWAITKGQANNIDAEIVPKVLKIYKNEENDELMDIIMNHFVI